MTTTPDPTEMLADLRTARRGALIVLAGAVGSVVISGAIPAIAAAWGEWRRLGRARRELMAQLATAERTEPIDADSRPADLPDVDLRCAAVMNGHRCERDEHESGWHTAPVTDDGEVHDGEVHKIWLDGDDEPRVVGKRG